jgi:hypothetical protein
MPWGSIERGSGAALCSLREESERRARRSMRASMSCGHHFELALERAKCWRLQQGSHSAKSSPERLTPDTAKRTSASAQADMKDHQLCGTVFDF